MGYKRSIFNFCSHNLISCFRKKFDQIRFSTRVIDQKISCPSFLFGSDSAQIRQTEKEGAPYPSCIYHKAQGYIWIFFFKLSLGYRVGVHRVLCPYRQRLSEKIKTEVLLHSFSRFIQIVFSSLTSS